MVLNAHRQPAESAADSRKIPLLADLFVVGVNHRTASIDLRDRIAISKDVAGEIQRRIIERFGFAELITVSTCNRTEFYWSGEAVPDSGSIFGLLPNLDKNSEMEASASAYEHSGPDAARHLFEVACGLDSMIVGETQILSQLKRAYETSHKLGYSGICLNFLFQQAFAVAKTVHTETRLSAHRSSVPSVALGLARALFEDLSKPNVLLVGSGEVARITITTLRKRGARQCTVVSRAPERVRQWAQNWNISVLPMSQLDEVLGRADILISCTSGDSPSILATDLQRARHDRADRVRPLLVLDFGVPRNVEDTVRGLEQVYLRNIDDLQAAADRNRALLEDDIAAARRLVSSAVDAFVSECRAATASAAITAVRTKTELLALDEFQHAMGRLSHLSGKDRDEVRALVHRIIGKVLHAPSEALHEASQNGDASAAALWARRLFGLGKSADRDDSGHSDGNSPPVAKG